VFVAIHRSGRWCVLSAIVPLRSHSYQPAICHEFGCPGVHLRKFQELWSISDSEGPDVPDASTPDTRANQLDLAGSSICDRMFLRRLEGPGPPGDWSYIGNYLSCLDLCAGSVSILTSPSSTIITPAPEGARVDPSGSACIEFDTGQTGPRKTRAPALFPAPPHSTAWGVVSFSAFPAPVPGQAPAPPIPQTGPR